MLRAGTIIHCQRFLGCRRLEARVGRRNPVKLTKVTVKFPWLGLAGGTWEANPTQRVAAWKLYVELVASGRRTVTGRARVPREALSSLYRLFPVTREVLRDAGPEVGGAWPSIGAVAVQVLNLQHPARPNCDSGRRFTRPDNWSFRPGQQSREVERDTSRFQNYCHSLTSVRGLLAPDGMAP